MARYSEINDLVREKVYLDSKNGVRHTIYDLAKHFAIIFNKTGKAVTDDDVEKTMRQIANGFNVNGGNFDMRHHLCRRDDARGYGWERSLPTKAEVKLAALEKAQRQQPKSAPSTAPKSVDPEWGKEVTEMFTKLVDRNLETGQDMDLAESLQTRLDKGVTGIARTDVRLLVNAVLNSLEREMAIKEELIAANTRLNAIEHIAKAA